MICERCGQFFEKDWRRDSYLIKKEPVPRFCSRSCSSSRQWSESDKKKKSIAATESHHVQDAAAKRRRVEERTCVVCGAVFEAATYRKKQTCSRACRNKLSSTLALERQHTRHHSRKDVLYRGVLLNSSYEEAVAKSLDEQGIEWVRPSPLRWEDSSGLKHYYYPDFYLPAYNVFLDPKNDYLINNVNKWFGITDKEKIGIVSRQNAVKILILSKDQLLWEKIEKLLADS